VVAGFRVCCSTESDAGNSPPDTGGVAAAAINCRVASLAPQMGWSASRSVSSCLTTPSGPSKVASRYLLDVASPLLFEEPVQVMFVGAVYERAYRRFAITWTGSSKRRGVRQHALLAFCGGLCSRCSESERGLKPSPTSCLGVDTEIRRNPMRNPRSRTSWTCLLECRKRTHPSSSRK
jgi:hypothetical protein